MKEKIKRILKYVGIGFGGLFILTMLLVFILPEPDPISVQITEQPKEGIADEVIEIAEDLVEDVVEEPEPEVIENISPPVVVETPPVVEAPPAPVEIPQETEAPAEEDEVIVETGEKYYTSSHYSAQYYYPEDCSFWEELSPSYLKSFNSLESLLTSYNRTLSPQCN